MNDWKKELRERFFNDERGFGGSYNGERAQEFEDYISDLLSKTISESLDRAERIANWLWDNDYLHSDNCNYREALKNDKDFAEFLITISRENLIKSLRIKE